MAFMVTGALADLAASGGGALANPLATLRLAHAGEDADCLPGLHEFWRFYRCRADEDRIDGLFDAETTMSVASLEERLSGASRIVLVVRPSSAATSVLQGYARMLVRRRGPESTLALPVGDSTEEGDWAETGHLVELPRLVYRSLDGARDWWVLTPNREAPVRLFHWVDAGLACS